MKLKKLEVTSFAGLNPESPIVIDFTQSKFVKVSGDQGTGKTSLLIAMLVACGQLSKDNKDYVNLSTGKIDIDFSFIGRDNCSYDVKVTKSSFRLMYDGVAQPEPISKMKSLLGVTGTSPMEIKFKPLKDIIRWLSSYSNKTAEEFDSQLLKFKTGIKSAKESRALANKSLKALNEFLDGDEMFINWEASEKKYVKAPDIKELSNSLTTAGNKSDKYIQNDSKVKAQKTRKAQIDDQVSLLMKEAEEVNKNIAIGEKWLDDNKTAKKDYDEIKKKYDTAAQDISKFNRWQEIKKKKYERDEYETLSQRADAKEKELINSVKEFQSELLPNIKGMYIVTEDTTEDGVEWKEGLYRDGINVAQMSESEWVDTVIEIWRKNKAKIVVLDNIGTLGSKAVERLTKLSNDGCTILSAEMDRKIQELQISYE